MKNVSIGSLLAICLTTLGIGAAAFSSDIDPVPMPSQEAGASVVIFVRHAETVTSTSTTRDPVLSVQGEARAEALARLLANSKVSHLFASEYKRTQATLAPLGSARALNVSVHPARKADELVSALRGLPAGSVAVVAGHSNTVPQLVTALGGQPENLVEHPTHGKMLGETQYDRLFVVPGPTFGASPAPTIELRYGCE